MGDAVADWLVPVAVASTYMALALRAAASGISRAGNGAHGGLAFLLILVLAGVAAVCIAIAARAL